MNYMAMAGWKTGDMLDSIEGIMNLAVASEEDLATTSVDSGACGLAERAGRRHEEGH